MKISQFLADRIAAEYASTHPLELLPEPPVPTGDEFATLIEATVPYSTTTERENLAHTHDLKVNLIERESVMLKTSKPLPILQQEARDGWELNDEWIICCHYANSETIDIDPSDTSKRVANYKTKAEQRQAAKLEARRRLRHAGSIPAVRRNYPELCSTPSFRAAEQDMVRKREEAKARKKNKKPLEKVELETDPSIIIAKARLLGAKYVP